MSTDKGLIGALHALTFSRFHKLIMGNAELPDQPFSANG